MKMPNIKSRRTVIVCIKYNDGRLTGLDPFRVGTAYYNTLLTGRWRGREKLWEEGEENISSYWMTSKKREDNEN
jgi:hypothetical protein